MAYPNKSGKGLFKKVLIKHSLHYKFVAINA